ncbi:MAG: hypothetical protein KDA60_15815 [Planctomycetales bacterium]|nr:hypothetical protein [Planctomycetales bacterium]
MEPERPDPDEQRRTDTPRWHLGLKQCMAIVYGTLLVIAILIPRPVWVFELILLVLIVNGVGAIVGVGVNGVLGRPWLEEDEVN